MSRVPVVVFISVFVLITVSRAREVLPGTRDPWLWPFSDTSIWNMPVGSDAEYTPAGFEDAGHVGVDIQHVVELDSADPLRQAFLSTSFGPGRCSGTESIDFWLPIADDWIVPDAGNSPYGRTPNSNFSLRLPPPDNDSVFEGGRIARCTAGGPFYIPDWMRWPNNRRYQHIEGDGRHGRGQGASGMSSLGGTIRLGELVNDTPIRHVIKINPWAAKYCHYSEEIPGWKWPAFRADGYAPERYNRDGDPDIVMGSLFAIPPDVTEASLNLQTAPGRKLFFTLKYYGAYFTEDAAWDTWDLIVERDAEIEFERKYGFSMKSTTWKSEVNKLMRAVHVVTNNTPAGIGGGGTPLQPLAPPFKDEVTDQPDPPSDDFPASRDPLKWPFAKTSIWNMPIGSSAKYVHAGITPQTGRGTVNYHDILILTPDEPLMEVYAFPGGWSSDRCITGNLLGRMPIPNDFFVPFTGKTSDNSTAILARDGRTLVQTQPFHRCTGADHAVTKWWNYNNTDIFGDGRLGAHGGSALSSIGGTIRLGEFAAGVIRHAVKISMYAHKYYHYDKADDPTPGYRWPALRPDKYADGEYAGPNPAFEMGSLLALKPDFDIMRCTTEPGRILARAFKNYGGYIVDDSKWDVFKLCIEWSPEGRVDEEFEKLFGYPWAIRELDHPWPRDLAAIFTSLHVIDNNGPNSIGGGGTPRRPLAPPFRTAEDTSSSDTAGTDTTTVDTTDQGGATGIAIPGTGPAAGRADGARPVEVFDLHGRRLGRYDRRVLRSRCAAIRMGAAACIVRGTHRHERMILRNRR